MRTSHKIIIGDSRCMRNRQGIDSSLVITYLRNGNSRILVTEVKSGLVISARINIGNAAFACENVVVCSIKVTICA